MIGSGANKVVADRVSQRWLKVTSWWLSSENKQGKGVTAGGFCSLAEIVVEVSRDSVKGGSKGSGG